MAGTPGPGAAAQIECHDASNAARLLAEVFGQCAFKPLPEDGRQFGMIVTRLEYEVANFVRWQFETSGELTLSFDRHLVLTVPQGTIIVWRGGTETIVGTSALILSPGSAMTLIWSGSIAFTGVLIRDNEFQRGARAILPTASKLSLDSEWRFDLSTYPGTAFAELIEFLETDRKNGRASQNSKSIRQLFDRLTIYALLRIVEHGTMDGDAALASIVPRHVKQSEEYVKSHLNEILDTGVLAALVDVSPRSLYRAFIHFRGISPARYIQDMRLDAAHRLITGGEKKDLHSIAEGTGFKSYAAFWRSYVRKYGVAPSKARREAE
jgi:AraC-like DNA-binding protein